MFPYLFLSNPFYKKIIAMFKKHVKKKRYYFSLLISREKKDLSLYKPFCDKIAIYRR
tara:strand:- start:1297 stop:1467 length:171 start_codon:yes stop_codon:yes gene_type:complete